MSSGELEVRQETAPQRVVPPKPRTDDWALVIAPISSLAEQVSNTEFVPAALRGKPAAVAAAILFGRELDMPPMQALQQVHVIDGRPSLSAEHKRAMILEKGHLLSVTGDGGQATATGRRLLYRYPQTGEPVYGEPSTVTWTLAMATAAGLTGKKNWQKHPRQMLKARATAELANDLFADITHGLATLEELQDDDAVPSSAPAPATEKVSRAKKGVTSRPAVGVGTAETPAPAATPTAPVSVAPPEVPLPGEEGPADSTPGEGLGNQSTSSPAGPPSMAEAQAADLKAYDAPPRQCPNISNGQQCRYAADHLTRGVPHTYGGGLQDPVSARHCDITKKHEPHAWNSKGNDWHSCGGEEFQTPAESLEFEAEHGISPEEQRKRYAAGHVVDAEIVQNPDTWGAGLAAGSYPAEDVHLPDSEGDGSPDDLAATAPDEVWEAAQDATGGPVPENDPPLSSGKRRLLLAAFNALGVTDRSERLHTSSALLGRQIETWTTLTSGDGDKLIKAVNGLKTRDELEKLVQRAAAEWGAQP